MRSGPGGWGRCEDVGEVFALECEEGVILLEVECHVVVVLVIDVQLCKDGFHHPPVERALRQVLQSSRRMSETLVTPEGLDQEPQVQAGCMKGQQLILTGTVYQHDSLFGFQMAAAAFAQGSMQKHCPLADPSGSLCSSRATNKADTDPWCHERLVPTCPQFCLRELCASRRLYQGILEET